MRKRYYIIFVARQEDGELRKVPIPLHYAYIFVASAVIGLFTITGMAGSYSRMLLKTAHFNQVRTERETLRHDYLQMEQVAHEKDVQAASLGSLASEVSALYGLRESKLGKPALRRATATASPATELIGDQQYSQSLDQLMALRSSAMSGEIMHGLDFSHRFPMGFSGTVNMADAPSEWPVQGIVTSSFGARLDPFNGEGAFHSGIDIATSIGDAVRSPADGTVIKAGMGTGYGREVIIDHGHGIETLYAHLSGFAVTTGQDVRRGDILGYVGSSGHSTGPHLHYEVRIHDTPVNPLEVPPCRRTAVSERSIGTHSSHDPRRSRVKSVGLLAFAIFCGASAFGQSFLGFDRNDYPGDSQLATLHSTFSYTSYWLNNPPGDPANTWIGKRNLLKTNGFGFLILYNGRLDRELRVKDAAALGRSDAEAAVHAAKHEGFPPGAILFLDQEEGGRLLPEQSAYLFAWVEEVRKSQYKPGVYCSGILVGQISTAKDILSHEGGRTIALWVVNDACPPAPGCTIPNKTLKPAASGVPEASVWQFVRSPKSEFAGQCPGYASDNNCYAPASKTFIDLNLATSADPSRGR